MLNRIFFSILLVVSGSTLAFDNDLSINRPDFFTESFLDLNKAEFNEYLNDQWYNTENGWRISSHSLTRNLTYLNTEVKLHQDLSDYASMRMHYAQEVFYSDKENEAINLEFEVRPMPPHQITFSVLGNFNYAKSKSDLGYAITIGKRTASFFHFSDTTVDKYYNAKVDDDSRVIDTQHIKAIETAYHWTPSLQARFSYKDFSPMELMFDDQVTFFNHQGFEYDGFIKYKLNENNSYKIRIKGLDIEKSVSGTTDEAQKIKYDSVDLKWLARQQHAYKLSLGFRNDIFSNDIIAITTQNSVLEYPFRSRQIYSTVNHAYSTQKEWQIGLYVGLTKEPNDFLSSDPDNSRVHEHKLDFAWIYHSANKKSSVYMHISFNLDELDEDPGDGGGITYQSTF